MNKTYQSNLQRAYQAWWA